MHAQRLTVCPPAWWLYALSDTVVASGWAVRMLHGCAKLARLFTWVHLVLLGPGYTLDAAHASMCSGFSVTLTKHLCLASKNEESPRFSTVE
jgi:hypothetical protein